MTFWKFLIIQWTSFYRRDWAAIRRPELISVSVTRWPRKSYSTFIPYLPDAASRAGLIGTKQIPGVTSLSLLNSSNISLKYDHGYSYSLFDYWGDRDFLTYRWSEIAFTRIVIMPHASLVLRRNSFSILWKQLHSSTPNLHLIGNFLQPWDQSLLPISRIAPVKFHGISQERDIVHSPFTCLFSISFGAFPILNERSKSLTHPLTLTPLNQTQPRDTLLSQPQQI